MPARIPTFRDGLTSIARGFMSVLTWGQSDMDRAWDLAGLNDPRPADVKDWEALAGDWEAVERDFARAQQEVTDAIKNGTVTPDHFRGLGDCYDAYIKSRTT